MQRVAMLSVHTSPLDRPGGGDAGGMNVYIVETAKRMADAGVAVEIFTRSTCSAQPRRVEMHPGVVVRHVPAGPFEVLAKNELPGQLCQFTAAVLRAEARHEPGYYDLIHSHYWLSGQVGWLARNRWGAPLVHTAHTLGKVKNAALADGDIPEPLGRLAGEQQVVAEADRLVASTDQEMHELIRYYGADPDRVDVVAPGVDLTTFAPGPVDRAALGLPDDALVLLFVGRIQPLKAPDVLLRAAARMLATDPVLTQRLRVVVMGAPSGADPEWLPGLAATLGVPVHFVPPVGRPELAAYYRAADLTVVPSYSESFGLVALESQACGTPVVAAAVGGLPTAVADGRSGVLVEGHDPRDWAKVLAGLLHEPRRRTQLALCAREQALRFSWNRTTAELLRSYELATASRVAELQARAG
ncbi:MAG TPA: D-inositol-3-phosphate glycosyltransferase [Jatrophihabitantaceae bacterium]